MSKKKDLKGIRFGRLLVLETDGQNSKKNYLWRCVCDCGSYITVLSDSLVQGKTKSCGCLHKDVAKNSHTTHGENRRGKMTPEYRAWSCMKSRCTNPNVKYYPNYGGAGVKICKRWMNSFENFLHDMGRKPSLKHSLDRHPKINGNYKPNNCRWATKKEQSQGRKNVIWVEHEGNRMVLADWAIFLKVEYGTLLSMYHRGRPFNKIVSHYKNKK